MHPRQAGRVRGAARRARSRTRDVADRDDDDTAVILYTSGTTGTAQGRRAHPREPAQQRRGRRASLFDARATTPSSSARCRCSTPSGRRAGMNAAICARRDADAASRASTRPRRSRSSSATRSPSSRACRRCTARCSTTTATRTFDTSCARGVRLRRRGDAGRADARLRGGVRLQGPRGLRPVGDLAGRLVQPPRQGAQARLDRHADRGRRDEGRRRRRQRGRPGRGRRDRHQGPQRHEGLLEPPGRHRGGDQGRLVPHRRHGQGRRGRLLLHRRPQEGPDHPRRLQRLPARDRGGPLRAPGRARGRRRRRPARRPGRGGRRRGRAQGGRGRRREDELRRYVKEQVAAYKYPRKVWFVDELPKGPTGKILKREIEVPEEAKTA